MKKAEKKEKAEARGLNGEEIIKQRYGLKWNDKDRAFDIVDYAIYWTNVLQMGQAVGSKYELAYQQFAESQAEKALEYQNLLDKQAESIKNLDESSTPVNIHALAEKLGDSVDFSKYGYIYDKTTGELTAGENADYEGLQRAMYEAGAIYQNRTAEYIEMWRQSLVDDTIAKTKEKMDMGEGSEDDPTPMDSVLLGQVVRHNRARLIYLFDMFAERAFYIELVGSAEPNPALEYPRVAFENAPVPDQYDPDAVDSNAGSIFEEMMDDFGGFDGDGDGDDEW